MDSCVDVLPPPHGVAVKTSSALPILEYYYLSIEAIWVLQDSLYYPPDNVRVGAPFVLPLGIHLDKNDVTLIDQTIGATYVGVPLGTVEIHTLFAHQIQEGVNISGCGNYSNVYVYAGQHLKNGPNNIYCKGKNCTVYADGKTVRDTTIYCYGDGCTAECAGKSTNVTVYCCGTGCTAACTGPGNCTAYINNASYCPAQTPLCESTWCDENCNTSSDDEILAITAPYSPPALKSEGSSNITIYYDIDGDDNPDGNFTMDVTFGSGDTFDPCYDPNNCTSDNILDSADFSFALLMDLANTEHDQNDILPLLYNYSINDEGDGGKNNPIDVNSSNIGFHIVHGSNIRSLWGPVEFRLTMWM